MSDDWKTQLESRFACVARGRTVSVRFEPKDFILADDYHVAFNATTDTFEVVLRRGGCFEGAYRCIERFIEVQVEGLEGINSVAVDHLDLRRNMQYWMLEKVYEVFRSDLESAIATRVSWLERERPGENVLGEIVIETRTRSLVGMLAHLETADREVRRGILSPPTVELLKSILPTLGSVLARESKR